MKQLIATLSCLILCTGASFAETDSVEASDAPMAQSRANTSVCTFGGATRTIEIKYDKQPRRVPCRVLYTRDGATSELWRAENVEGYCEEKAASLADTLEASGWSCG